MVKKRNQDMGTGGGMARLPEPVRLAMHRGWVDAQNSPNRWSRTFEAAGAWEQRYYEIGRLWLCNVIAAGLPVPAWRGDVEGGAAVTASILIAADRVGPAVPGWFA